MSEKMEVRIDYHHVSHYSWIVHTIDLLERHAMLFKTSQQLNGIAFEPKLSLRSIFGIEHAQAAVRPLCPNP